MTPTVILRPYEETDIDVMAAAVRESLPELSQWFQWAHAEYSEKDAAEWLHGAQAARIAGTAHDFAIIDSERRYAGCCSVDRIQTLDGIANIGYWLRTSATRHGIATAAVQELVRWTFLNTGLNRLEIVAAASNFRSQRVAERVGAHRDAVLGKRVMVKGVPSDAVLYSILRPD